MQQDELAALIDKTATLMIQYERRSQHIDTRLQALGENLQGLLQQLPTAVKTSTQDVLRTLPGEMTNKMRDGMDQAMDDYRQSLGVAGTEVERSSRMLAAQIEQLQRLHRQLIWKTTGAAVLALTLLLGGGGWLSTHYLRVIRENQLTADQMKAYNAADLILCGATLCANVEARGPRYGDRRQYWPIKAR